MGRSTKKVKSDRINELKKKYDDFLEEDKKRKERNEYILGRLDKMRVASMALRIPYANPRAIQAPQVLQYYNSNIIPKQAIVQQIPSENPFIVKDIPTKLRNTESKVIQEISKRFILIPKLTTLQIENAISQAPPDDTDDWTSKYEILDQLKKCEKENIELTPNIKCKNTKQISFEDDFKGIQANNVSNKESIINSDLSTNADDSLYKSTTEYEMDTYDCNVYDTKNIEVYDIGNSAEIASELTKDEINKKYDKTEVISTQKESLEDKNSDLTNDVQYTKNIKVNTGFIVSSPRVVYQDKTEKEIANTIIAEGEQTFDSNSVQTPQNIVNYDATHNKLDLHITENKQVKVEYNNTEKGDHNIAPYLEPKTDEQHIVEPTVEDTYYDETNLNISQDYTAEQPEHNTQYYDNAQEQYAPEHVQYEKGALEQQQYEDQSQLQYHDQQHLDQVRYDQEKVQTQPYDHNQEQQIPYDPNQPEQLPYDPNQPEQQHYDAEQLPYDPDQADQLQYDPNQSEQLQHDPNQPEQQHYEPNQPEQLQYNLNQRKQQHYDPNQPEQLQYDPNQSENLQYDPNQADQLQYEPNQSEQPQYDTNQPEQQHYDPNQPEQLQYDPNQSEQLQYDPNQAEQLQYDQTKPDQQQYHEGRAQPEYQEGIYDQSQEEQQQYDQGLTQPDQNQYDQSEANHLFDQSPLEQPQYEEQYQAQYQEYDHKLQDDQGQYAQNEEQQHYDQEYNQYNTEGQNLEPNIDSNEAAPVNNVS